MKKIIVFGMIFMGLMGFSQAKIEFMDKENTIDYGTVYKDEDSGIRVFKFKNTGNEPLIIKNVQSTCGCTVPSKPTEPILPGQTGEISVKYNMNPGPIRKTITVECNVTNLEGGMVALKIKGEVKVREVVSPLQKKQSMLEK